MNESLDLIKALARVAIAVERLVVAVESLKDQKEAATPVTFKLDGATISRALVRYTLQQARHGSLVPGKLSTSKPKT